MKISMTSILVDDQDKALDFYTNVLGFVKKSDIPMDEFRWLTVVSPDGSQDIELLLEPNQNPAAIIYQKAIFDQGIPITMFTVDNLSTEFERLKREGVAFTMEPTDMDSVRAAVFSDTCGNLIQLIEHMPGS